MPRIIHAIPICALILVVASGCKSIPIPSGFWLSFDAHSIQNRTIDQGPWGGTLSLRWVTSSSSKFEVATIRKFAESHGWRYIEQQHHTGPSITSKWSASRSSTDPNFLPIPSTIIKFDSMWLREVPGTGEMNPAFGYAQISDDGSQLYVFHFWGNG